MKHQFLSLRGRYTALIAVALFGCFQASYAASPSTWSGLGGDSNWNTALNWTSSNVPVPGTTYDLVFGGTTNLSTYNNFTAASNFRNFTFSSGSGAFTLTGNSITLNGGVTNSSTSLQRIALDMSMTSGSHTFSTTAGGGDMIVSGVLSGTGGLGKSGNGTLTLTGVNTYTGVTSISGGILTVSTIGNGGVAGNLGAATNSASNLVFGNGTLRYIGSGEATDRNFTINAGSVGTIYVGANNLTLSGSAAATTGGLTKTGAGTLTFSGANAYTGVTTVSSGALTLDYTNTTNQILSSSSPIIMGNSTGTSTLNILGNASGAINQTLGNLTIGANGGHTSAAHINLIDNGTNPISVTFASPTSSTVGITLVTHDQSLGGGFTLDIKKSALDTVKIQGASNTGGTSGVLFMNSSVAAVTLNGTDWAAASTSGSTLVNPTFAFNVSSFTVADTSIYKLGAALVGAGIKQGTIITGINTSTKTITISATTSAASSTAITMFDTAPEIVAATYTNSLTGLTSTSNLDVQGSGGTLSSNVGTIRFDSAVNATLALGSTVVTGGILMTANQNSDVIIGGTGKLTSISRRQLAIIQNSLTNDLIINSVIANSGTPSDPTAIVFSGKGRTILTANNTYTSSTSITEGTLRISSNSNLGVAGSSQTPNQYSPGVVYLNGTLEARGTFALDGSGTASGVFMRPIVLGTDGVSKIDVDAGHTLTITGGITNDTNSAGSGGILTKSNTGTLVLAGANSMNGLVVNGGKVIANASNAQTTRTIQAQGMQLSLTLTSGSNTVTYVASGNVEVSKLGLAKGQLLASGSYIAAGTLISDVTAAYDSGTGKTTITLTLSKNATGNGSTNTAIFLNLPTTATFASGSTTMTLPSVMTMPDGTTTYDPMSNIVVGQTITGTGIDAGTVVVAVDKTARTVTLSRPTTSTNASNTEYEFGGVNQVLVTSGGTTGLVGGEVATATGFAGGTVQGIANTASGDGSGSIVTFSGRFTDMSTAVTGTFNAYDSLGTSSTTVTVNAGGELDLGGIAHSPVGDVLITGGTISNGTMTGASYTANNAGAALISANLAGAGIALTKSGAGTLTLSGTNTFTGATTVNEGLLLVDGSLASGSAVTVNNTGSIGGVGSMGALTLNSGAVILPGTDGTIGTLSVASLIWNGGAIYDVDLGAGNTADLLVVSGAFTKGSGSLFQIALKSLGGINVGDSFKLVQSGSTTFLASDFTYTTLDGITGIFSFVGNDLYFTVTAIPEPSTWMLIGMGLSSLGVIAFLRRKISKAA